MSNSALFKGFLIFNKTVEIVLGKNNSLPDGSFVDVAIKSISYNKGDKEPKITFFHISNGLSGVPVEKVDRVKHCISEYLKNNKIFVDAKLEDKLLNFTNTDKSRLALPSTLGMDFAKKLAIYYFSTLPDGFFSRSRYELEIINGFKNPTFNISSNPLYSEELRELLIKWLNEPAFIHFIKNKYTNTSLPTENEFMSKSYATTYECEELYLCLTVPHCIDINRSLSDYRQDENFADDIFNYLKKHP